MSIHSKKRNDIIDREVLEAVVRMRERGTNVLAKDVITELALTAKALNLKRKPTEREIDRALQKHRRNGRLNFWFKRDGKAGEPYGWMHPTWSQK